jgi:hypothetical protein
MLKSLKQTQISIRCHSGVLTGAGVAALVGVTAAAPAARAQNLPLFDDTTIRASNITPSKRAFDILRGQNKTGPYPLSWTNLRIMRSDPAAVVNVNGKDIAADAYSLDAAKGTITFRESLAETAYVRVEYNYDPQLSKRNADVITAPVTLTETRVAGTSLQLMALPSVGDGKSSTTDAAKLVFGMGGKTSLLGGGLTSQLFFGDAGNGKTGVMDRAGMKLGYGTGNAQNGMDVQFQRAGAGFAPTTGKAFGMGSANQNWSLGTRLKPASWMSTSFKMADVKDLSGKASSKDNDLGLSLGGVRGTDPKFNFAKTDSLKIAADGKETRVSSDKMDLAQKLAPSLSLAAKTETNKLDSPDQAKDLTNKVTTYSLASKNAKGNITQAAFTLTQGEKETFNAQEKSNVIGMQLQPTGNVSFSLAQKGLVTTTGTADENSENDREVTAKDTVLSLASKNAKGNITQAAVSLTQGTTEGPDSTQKRQTFGVQLQPAGTLALSVSQKGVLTTTGIDDEKSENDRAVETSDTTISLASKNAKGNITQAAVSLTQGTTATPETSEKRQSLTLQVQPSSNLTLSLAQNEKSVLAVVGTDKVAEGDKVSTTSLTVVGANLQLAPNAKVTGSVQQGAQDSGTLAITNVSAQFGLSKQADVTGGVITRDASLGGVNDLDTKQLRLALRPSSTLSLSGGVVLNPQDDKGIISEAKRQDLALTIKQGAWEVGSGYAITTLMGVASTDTRGLALQTGEMSLNLGLRVSPFSRLTGTYKNSFLYGNTNPDVAIGPRGILVYGLNYTHSMGDAFSLTLGGTMTDNKMKTDVNTQGLKAEAKARPQVLKSHLRQRIRCPR